MMDEEEEPTLTRRSRKQRRSSSGSRSDESRHHRHKSHDRQRSSDRRHKSDRHERDKPRHRSRSDRIKSIDLSELEVDVEDEVAKLVARKIKSQADEEVRLYISSNEFKSMVDTMKRRERERIMSEVQLEIEEEKSMLLAIAREKIKKEHQSKLDAEEILLQNKLRIEEQRRKEYELKMKQDAERLEEVQRKQKLEAELERQALLNSSTEEEAASNDVAVPLKR
mmetsp:Transcript_14775/g.20301  ORF Transcript_14775/g.20301 Transcript_14775/m.20301 type:complete len:224 (+) Transcript_14775:11-682(+)